MDRTSSSKYQQGDVVKVRKDGKEAEAEVVDVKMRGGKYVYVLEGEKEEVPEAMLKAASREARIAARVEKAVLLSGPEKFGQVAGLVKRAYEKSVDLASWVKMDRDAADAAERREALRALEEAGTHLNRAAMSLTDAERSGYFD